MSGVTAMARLETYRVSLTEARHPVRHQTSIRLVELARTPALRNRMNSYSLQSDSTSSAQSIPSQELHSQPNRRLNCRAHKGQVFSEPQRVLITASTDCRLTTLEPRTVTAL